MSGALKRVSPYTALRGEIVNFCRKIRFPRVVTCWSYPKDKLGESWRLDALAERVQAAKLIGFETVLEVGENGSLAVKFREIVKVPYHWED